MPPSFFTRKAKQVKRKIRKMDTSSLRGDNKWETIINHAQRMLERYSLSSYTTIEWAEPQSFMVKFANPELSILGEDILTQSFSDSCIVEIATTGVMVTAFPKTVDMWYWAPEPLPGKYDSFWLKYQNQKEVSPMVFDPKAIGKKMPGFNRTTPCSGRGHKRHRRGHRYSEKGKLSVYEYVFEDEGVVVDATPRVCTGFRGKNNKGWLKSYVAQNVRDLRAEIWNEYIGPYEGSCRWSRKRLEENGFDLKRLDSLSDWTDREVRDFTIKHGWYYERLFFKWQKDNRLNIRRKLSREKEAFRDSFIFPEKEVVAG